MAQSLSSAVRPRISSGSCAFCEAPLQPGTQHSCPYQLHFTYTPRENVRLRLMSGSESLGVYHQTNEHLAKKLPDMSKTKDQLAGFMIPTLRTWRANELLGRNKYLAQMLEAPCSTDVELHCLLADLLQNRSKIDSLQVILALENTFRESKAYVLADESSATFPPHLRTALANHLTVYIRVGSRVDLILQTLNSKLVTPLLYNTKALSSELLRLQKEIPGAESSWNEGYDRGLLTCLGNNQSIPECARLLNVVLLRNGFKARSVEEVSARIEFLLR